MRILLVEDHLISAKQLKNQLRSRFVVDICNSGSAALDQVNEYDYGAIILDVCLPDISGFGVCKLLRADDNPTPIIFLSGKSLPQDRVNGLKLGANDYLAKPVIPEELILKLQLLAPAPLPHHETQVGQLKLNNQTMEITMNHQVLQLSQTEYRLMSYLMKHANQPLNRYQLLEHVWNSGLNSTINTVTVHVARLRKKLVQVQAQAYLQTKQGVGYMLKPPD